MTSPILPKILLQAGRLSITRPAWTSVLGFESFNHKLQYSPSNHKSVQEDFYKKRFGLCSK